MDSRASSSAIDRALTLVAALVPAIVAATHATLAADGARDGDVVRVLGLGFDGSERGGGFWRGMDAVASAAWMAVPLGTRSFRAALAAAFACALAGACAYVVARALLAACSASSRGAGRGAPKEDEAESARGIVLRRFVALVAALSVGLSPTWQLEGTAVGGAALAAVVALVPLVLLVRGAPMVFVAALTGLACAGGAAPALASLLSCASWLAATWATRSRPVASAASQRRLATMAGAFACGLVPLVAFAAWRRGAVEYVLLGGSSAALRPAAFHPVAFARDQIGVVICALASAGLVLSLLARDARPHAAALVALLVAGLGGAALGWHAAPQIALAAATLLAGVTMQAIVVAVARARVPFATASAAMVVVLELAFPAVALDEASFAASARAATADAPWSEEIAGALPPRAILVLRGRDVTRRFLAARASGDLRGDLTLLRIDDLGARAALRELPREPALAPLFRDMALAGAPSEFALASLAAARPLALQFDPAWERTLARHLVPAGALDLFFQEPRGAVDRKRALDAFLAGRDRLARALGAPSGDPAMATVTALLLRPRALAYVAANERELLPRAIDDVRAFDPHDALADELVRRIVATPRGPIDLRGLDVTRTSMTSAPSR